MAEVTQPGSTLQIVVEGADESSQKVDNEDNNTKMQLEGGNEYRLECSTASQYQTVPLTEVKDFWGLVTMVAPEHEETDRSGIDCVCVMDVSGSMQGEKISLARKAMRRLVRCLTSKDRVCLVTFDTNITTVMEFTSMDAKGKEYAKSIIKKIRAGSQTNLVGGLVTGISKLKAQFDAGNMNEVSSVLLFTDGQANVGVSSPDGILREALAAVGRKTLQGDARKWSTAEVLSWLDSVGLPYKEAFEKNQVDGMMLVNDLTAEMLTAHLNVTALHLPKFSRELKKLRDQGTTTTQGENALHFNVTVNTFGFGANHNNDLLDNIATAFDGMYYYMENEPAIVGGFANCLGGMLSTVAQELTVTIRAGSELVTNLKVRRDENVTVNPDGSVKVVIGDLQSEESQDVLVSCDLAEVKEADKEFVFFTCEVGYKNLVDDNHCSESLRAIVNREETEKSEGVNMKLDVERNRVYATEAMDVAKNMGDRNKYAEGRKVITEAINKIKASPSANDAFVTSLQSDLGTCLTGLRDRSQYVSMGKGYMRQNVKCHKKKRAANFQRSYASQNHYQTKSRSARYEDFSRADSDDSDEEDNINLDPRRARRQRKAKTVPSILPTKKSKGGKKMKRKSKKRMAPPPPILPTQQQNAFQIPMQQQIVPPVQQQQIIPPMQQQQIIPPMQQQQIIPPQVNAANRVAPPIPPPPALPNQAPNDTTARGLPPPGPQQNQD